MGNTALCLDNGIIHIPVEMVRTNPYQPRKFFDRAGLEELASSIKEYGLMQPITVRIVNVGSYELVAGERRLRASKLAGMTSIPAILVQAGEQDSAVLAMIENIQRQNLHFLEEASGLQNLMADYAFTQEELARKIGKSQSAVANKLRLLRLSRDIQRTLVENDLTERHARALLKLEDEELQQEVLKKVVKYGLTVKRTEDMIENILNGKKEVPEDEQGSKVKSIIRDLRIFTNTFEQTVEKMTGMGINAAYAKREVDGGCDIVIKVRY